MKKTRLIIILMTFTLLVSNVIIVSASEKMPIQEDSVTSEKTPTLNNTNPGKEEISPNAVGANIAGSFIAINSSNDAIYYSGKITSANTWISASIQETEQYMSAVGSSWSNEKVQTTVYSDNSKTLVTPTYFDRELSWGYYRSKNYFKAYFPSNIIPSYWSNTCYSAKQYVDDTYE
ncbi:hypothetical protein E4K67_15530 [Desulfosporosinus fructosivorans]|uniref:Uncharacterized protein n=1 Tax=Desulfosporosinus fructosivorans TaxID=2018669 RepID=A0A4Z0R4K5_9FIRM|nr:hypothetical protein [Desulfosporosinus fructosivorans]TGE37265.1 hypothetical protein E4K67_15530 [Desulfosporosinus fructosivorans]